VTKYKKNEEKIETYVNSSEFEEYTGFLKETERFTNKTQFYESTPTKKSMKNIAKSQIFIPNTQKPVYSNVSEKCSEILKTLIRNLENLNPIEILNLDLEFIKDLSDNLWLIGIQNFIFREINNNNNITNKPSIVMTIKSKNKYQKCYGEFCDLVWNSLMFVNDQGDAKETQRVEFWVDKNNQKIKQKDDFTKFTIEQKSILLNKEEISNMKHIEELKKKDPLLIFNRKCIFISFYNEKIVISFTNLMNSEKYKHMRLANLFNKVNICKSCHRAYMTIDQARQKYFENLQTKSQQNAPKMHNKLATAISKFYSTRNIQTASFNSRYSSKNSEICKTLTRNSKKNLISSFSHKNSVMAKQNFADFGCAFEDYKKFDSVNPYIHINPKTKKISVPKQELELFGLKFALGHTSNLSRDYLLKKSFLTRSSYRLNKLTDLHTVGDALERKIDILNENAGTMRFSDLQKRWLMKRSTILSTPFREFTPKCCNKNSDQNTQILSSGIGTKSSQKIMNLRMLATVDDIAIINKEKAKKIEEKHIENKKYFEDRDSPDIEPKFGPLCELAESIISRNNK